MCLFLPITKCFGFVCVCLHAYALCEQVPMKTGRDFRSSADSQKELQAT